MTDRSLPLWADDLRRRYLRGEASIFILHGNVYDAVLSGGEVLTLTDFLGNVLILISENLTDLAPKIVSNPKVAVVEVPMPDTETRKAAARLADARMSEKDADRYAEITAGLKAIQILSILPPPPATEEEARE